MSKSESEIYKGSCLCGENQFELTGSFDSFYLCHCRFCKKDTGSAHAANLFSKSAVLKWQNSNGKKTVFNLPGSRHTKSFCTLCGSALPTEHGGGRLVVVPAGSLDDEISIKPTAHLFVSRKANWEAGINEVAEFDELPGKSG